MTSNGNGSSIADRAQTEPGPDAQDGMFDVEWTDADLEAALERREAAREARLRANKDFKVVDTIVKDQLKGFELAAGEFARCGRFRIKKRTVQGKSVSFETQGSERLAIELVAD